VISKQQTENLLPAMTTYDVIGCWPAAAQFSEHGQRAG